MHKRRPLAAYFTTAPWLSLDLKMQLLSKGMPGFMSEEGDLLKYLAKL